MKLTKSKLKQIIKEELGKVMEEGEYSTNAFSHQLNKKIKPTMSREEKDRIEHIQMNRIDWETVPDDTLIRDDGGRLWKTMGVQLYQATYGDPVLDLYNPENEDELWSPSWEQWHRFKIVGREDRDDRKNKEQAK